MFFREKHIMHRQDITIEHNAGRTDVEYTISTKNEIPEFESIEPVSVKLSFKGKQELSEEQWGNISKSVEEHYEKHEYALKNANLAAYASVEDKMTRELLNNFSNVTRGSLEKQCNKTQSKYLEQKNMQTSSALRAGDYNELNRINEKYARHAEKRGYVFTDPQHEYIQNQRGNKNEQITADIAREMMFGLNGDPVDFPVYQQNYGVVKR